MKQIQFILQNLKLLDAQDFPRKTFNNCCYMLIELPITRSDKKNISLGLLEEWVKKKRLECHFSFLARNIFSFFRYNPETITETQLNDVFSRFFAELQTKHGKFFKSQ